MPYKVTIDREKCVKCGVCASVCDENFEMDDTAKVKQEVVDEIGCNQEAADACPEKIITVEEVK